MLGLLAIGFVAGLIAGVSPCILPVLPVVFVGWTTESGNWRRDTRRAVAVVFGLVVSFSLITLASSAVLDALHLPSTFLHDLGIVMLIVLGVAMIVPGVERFIEIPFRRLGLAAPNGAGSGLVLGLALGAVFVPCAGPVLATISVLGATRHVGLTTVLLTALFALGASLPLLAVALAGERVVERNAALRTRARRLRPLGGALLIVMALGISLNWFSGLQRWLPSYTSSLQSVVEGSSFAEHQLHALSQSPSSPATTCQPGSAVLADCGAAPEFTGISTWLNTPSNRPLTLAGLRGKVVLVDFWTYSCINCQRTLAHVEAWWQRYRADGLVIVGVHSPEFAFEHDVSNVASAARSLDVRYPIAIDNDLATWNAYTNEYWPAEYLVDASGTLRHVAFGEGEYASTETLIRSLLVAANPHVTLPARTDVADQTPTSSTISPETYLGYSRLAYLRGASVVEDQYATYRAPRQLDPYSYALAGRWRIGAESMTAGRGARLRLNFSARHVYLVMSGTGVVRVNVAGTTRTVAVSGYPKLYELYSSNMQYKGLMNLDVPKGVAAYDFTFG